MSKLGWVIAYWLSRAGLLLPRRVIPTSWGYAVADLISGACYFLFRPARRTLESNLERVLGSRDMARTAARSTFRNYGRYVIDLFQLSSLSPETIRNRVDFDGWEHIEEDGSARGTIFVTLHLGQWEMGAAALVAAGFPISVIAQTLSYPPMNDLVQKIRRDLGMRVIPAEKSALETFRCLARKETLGMLIDVIEPGEGVEVDFFGGRAEMSPAPARLALRSGARVVPAVLARDPGNPLTLRPVIDPDFAFTASGDDCNDEEALTQAIAKSLEGLVRRFPDQWFAFHSIWRKGSEASWTGEGARNLAALKFAEAVFGRFPKFVNYRVASITADLAFRRMPAVRAAVEDNMRHVLGAEASDESVEAAGREVVRNVTRYYADLLRLPRTSGKDLLEREITLAGFERLRAALAEGKGAIVATAHFGNPEIAVQVAKEFDLDLLVLSEPLDPPELSEFVHRLRRSNGIEYIEVGYRSIARTLAHLRKGGLVAITCDRDIQHNGTPLLFFGEETPLPLGAVDLAARTGAALVPAYCRRIDTGYEVVFEERLELKRSADSRADARENARRLLARAEHWIRSDPGQWMVLEQIWKRPPPADKDIPAAPPEERVLAGAGRP